MRKYATLTFALVIFIGTSLFAQDDSVVVKVSKEKVKISGKYYYIHTVREGETLYNIARAYQIAQAAIIESNPELYKGVKLGNTIKVPVVQELKNPNPNKNTFHIVKKGETLYSISKEYNVPIDVLSRVNLLEKTEIKENQSIYIPTEKSAKVDKRLAVEPVVSDSHSAKGDPIMHQVLPKETLYSISKKYSISQDEIEAANPVLKTEGLKVGQVLTIVKSAKKDDSKSVDTPKKKVESKDCSSYRYNPSTRFNVVLMLPFSIAATSSDTAVSNAGARKYDDIMQYYQGTLIAIDSLKKSGVSVNLTVIDTKNDKDLEAIEKGLKNPALKDADLIIGPVYPTAIPVVAKYAESHSIPMVSPLASLPQLVKENPYLIQVATDAETIRETSMEYAKRHINGQTILVYAADGSDSKLVKDFKASLKIKLPELTYHQGGNAQVQRNILKSKLLADKQNRFIVLSNNEVFVLDFLQNLSVASKGYNIEVLGTSKWLKFTSVDMQYIHDSNVEIVLPNYVDFNEAGAKSFTRSFRSYFKNEPNNYAFRGFDVAFYFIDALKVNGPQFLGCLTNNIKSNIHTPFHFAKYSENSGYINTDAVLIKHTDGFKVEKVKL